MQIRSCARIEDFIERMGLSLQEDGWPRIAGRMFAFFVVHGGPFSFSELAERLQISRASVSTNTRVLRGLGFIERVARPGDRQDYYQLADDPYVRLLDGYIDRMEHRCTLIDAMRGALPETEASQRGRLEAIGDFYRDAIDATEQLGERMRAVQD